MPIAASSPEALQILSEIGFDVFPSSWDITRIGELLASDRGISVGVMYPGEHDPNGIPLIKAGDLSGNRINQTPNFRISPAVHKEYIRTEFQGGEVILTLVGDIGRCAVVPSSMRGWNSARATAVIRLADQTDAPFLRLCLLSKPIQHLMNAWATTTVQATLNLKEIRNIPVPWPSKSERDRIADILGTLDDKIDLNRRTNETLEAMAKALFKSWFVDFDPVRETVAGRKPAGLDAETARLFPSEFEDSVLGRVPTGWGVGTVGDIADINREGVNPGDHPSEVFDHYSIPAYDEGAQPKPEFGSTIMSNKFVVPESCVLVSKLNPRIPRVWLPVRATHRGVCSTEFLVNTPKSGCTKEFLYCLFSSDAFCSEFATMVTGTSGSHQRVKPESLTAMSTVIPNKPVIARFTEFVRPLLKRIAANREESRTLAETRDALLPKLLSGELAPTNK